MLGSIDNSADLFIFEALHKFWLFAIFHIELVNFEVLYVVSGVSCDAKLIDLNMFALLVVFLVKHVNAFEFFQMNCD